LPDSIEISNRARMFALSDPGSAACRVQSIWPIPTSFYFSGEVQLHNFWLAC
jgi:hypothetical protein